MATIAGSTGELVTRQQAAHILGVSERTIIRLSEVGELPLVRLGARAVRLRRDDVAALIDRRTVHQGRT